MGGRKIETPCDSLSDIAIMDRFQCMANDMNEIKVSQGRVEADLRVIRDALAQFPDLSDRLRTAELEIMRLKTMLWIAGTVFMILLSAGLGAVKFL